MDILATFGSPGIVLAAIILLINTTVAAIYAQRNKYLSRRSKRLNRVEPVYLDLAEWAYNVQVWAANEGLRSQLPALPPSIERLKQVEEADPEPTPLIEQNALQRLGLRQQAPQQSSTEPSQNEPGKQS